MNKTIKMLALVAMAMVAVTAASAQDGKHRKSKEELAAIQAKHIAAALRLDEATTKRFTEAFCSQKKKVWDIEAKPTKVRENMTEEEAEKAIKLRFEHSQRILDIRRSGYAEYRKFLTPKQIEKVYRLEKQGLKHMAHMKQSKRPSPKGHGKGPRGHKGPHGKPHKR